MDPPGVPTRSSFEPLAGANLSAQVIRQIRACAEVTLTFSRVWGSIPAPSADRPVPEGDAHQQPGVAERTPGGEGMGGSSSLSLEPHGGSTIRLWNPGGVLWRAVLDRRDPGCAAQPRAIDVQRLRRSDGWGRVVLHRLMSVDPGVTTRTRCFPEGDAHQQPGSRRPPGMRGSSSLSQRVSWWNPDRDEVASRSSGMRQSLDTAVRRCNDGDRAAPGNLVCSVRREWPAPRDGRRCHYL